ncbi:MAG: tetratricopeptide repeat protein [Bacteroidaceae bacterium]|nr:tetratricopeptide repeat protein [Bacteroidaceae bacterium]
MKKLLTFIIAFAIVACNKENCVSPQLPEIEQQCDTAPHAAYSRLLEIDSERELPNEVSKAKYALLLTKSADKAYIRHTSDSTIKRALTYYESKGSTAELAEALYYMGSVYRDMYDAPKAVIWYNKAIETAQKDEKLKSSILLARIYSQLSELYDYQFNYTASLDAIRKAYGIKEMNRKIDATALHDIASSFHKCGKIDSAMLYYKRCLLHIEGNNRMREDLRYLGVMLYFFSSIGEDDYARRCLGFIDRYSMEQVPDNVLSNKAYWFEKQGMNDSAVYYYRKHLEVTDNCYKKRDIMGKLYNIYRNDGNSDAAMEVADKYMLYNDSVSMIMQNAETANADNHYRYSVNAERERELGEKAARADLLSWIIATVSLALTIAAYFIYRIAGKYRKLWQKHRNLEQSVMNDKKRKAQIALDTSDIRNEFKELAACGMKPKQYMTEELQSSVDKEYPTFKERILEAWPDIPADDLMFLYQIKLGISYAEIARIRGCAPSGITKRRHRIEKRLGCGINDIM